jgi:hypothetical protein
MKFPNPVRAAVAQSGIQIDMGWTTEGSDFESRFVQEYSLLHFVQTGSGTHSASYQMSTGGPFPGVKLGLFIATPVTTSNPVTSLSVS